MAKFKEKDVEQEFKTGEPVGGSALPGAAVKEVMVQHGIHANRFPLVGMTIAKAREELKHKMHIDPDAVAVVNGVIVAEDAVIDKDARMITFVKQAAVKGGENYGS